MARPAHRALRLAWAVLAPLLVALGALAVAAPAPASAGTPPRVPPQGIYDSCDPTLSADGCASRLRRLGEAGFKVVVNGPIFTRANADQLVAYAQAAQAAGISVIYPLHGTGLLQADLSDNNLVGSIKVAEGCATCETNGDVLAYIVGRLRVLPNTWGYYLADEPRRDKVDQVNAFVERVKALDPDHPRLVMGCGICYGGDPTGSNIAFLAPLDIALGTDQYPVREGGPDVKRAYDKVAQNAASLAKVARPGQLQVIALQAWRWGDSPIDTEMAGLNGDNTRFPTREEIQAQRDAAVTAGHPDLILWYTATQVIGWEEGQQRPSYWAQPTDTDQRWANLLGGAFAPLPNDRPVAQMSMLTRGRVEVGRTVVADARAFRNPYRRVMRYRWKLGARRLRCASRRCAFRPRRAGVQRLTLTVLNDRSVATAVHRSLRVRP
jgi:hypothetical protein